MPRQARAVRSATPAIARFHVHRTIGLLMRGLRRLAATGLPRGGGSPPQGVVHGQRMQGPARVLLVEAHTPRPDLDSGSVRTVALLRMLAEMGLPATLFVDDFRPGPVDAPVVPAESICDVGAAVDWLRRYGGDLRLVVLSRHTVAMHWLPLIRRELPRVPVVFDTVDLHFLRERRQADHLSSPPLRWLAALTRRRELGLVDRVEMTWVVSDVEREALKAARPDARIEQVSNVVDARAEPPPMAARRDFVFVGNFRHEPNLDAVAWLMELWPSIRLRCPDAALRIIGPFLPAPTAARLARIEGIEVVGHVADLDPHLLAARVMLAPLRYGAGVKGKLNAAFACGLPVVGTPCAVEGMGLESAAVALEADTDQGFVDHAARLYTDAALWQSMRAAATQCLEERFSSAAVKARLVSSLRILGVAPHQA